MSGLAKKILKILLYTLLVLLLFIASATAIFVATFDANLYKQDLSDLVRQQTGRELQFFGDVSLTVYPALGMQLGAMSFSNAPGFDAQSMVKVNKVAISVDVASLITLNPEVDQLLLQDLEINLQKNKSGKTNWDDLVKADAKATSTTTESDTTTTSSESEKMEIKGAFGGINMQNARLLWKDEQAGVAYRINDLDFTTGRITPDAPFGLQLQMAMQTSDGVEVNFDLGGQIQYLINESLLNIGDFELEVEAQGSMLPLGKIQIGFSSQATKLDLQRGNVWLEDLELRLDDSRLNGSINVTDFSKPALSYKLSSELLDIDALLGTPPVTQQTQVTVEAPTGEQAAPEDVQIALPMELLRSMQIDGQLSVKQIKLQNLYLNDVELKTVAKNGVLNLNPINMTLYGGRFQGSVQVDARAKTPKYQVRKTLSAVQIGKLMTDFIGEERISGELAAKVEINTGGEWLSALKKNSNGTMNLNLKDGALKGFNLRYSIDKAKAKLNKQPPPPEVMQTTDFSALGLSGKIKNGVFSSNDLNLQAPLLRVGGEGKANVNDNTVDYLVKAKLVGTVAGQAGGEADELKGLLIPVSIKGPFASPDIDVQLDEMLRAAANAKLKADIDQQKAELEKQLAEEKAALEAAKQRELEKQKAVLEAKKKAEQQKLKDKLLNKLLN
jgi:AsmA protein